MNSSSVNRVIGIRKVFIATFLSIIPIQRFGNTEPHMRLVGEIARSGREAVSNDRIWPEADMDLARMTRMFDDALEQESPPNPSPDTPARKCSTCGYAR